MPSTKRKPLRFVTAKAARIEKAPWGKHWWLSEAALTGTKLLTLVRVTMRPGTGHQFHHHPAREEIIYIVDGVAEQWVGREKRTLRKGECAFIPKKVVHAIFNSSKKPMTFLAILSPARAKGPFLVDCYDKEPWKSIRGSEARDQRSGGRSGRSVKPRRRGRVRQ
jgi:quercetin dioxygenase-like cupin family protein